MSTASPLSPALSNGYFDLLPTETSTHIFRMLGKSSLKSTIRVSKKLNQFSVPFSTLSLMRDVNSYLKDFIQKNSSHTFFFGIKSERKRLSVLIVQLNEECKKTQIDFKKFREMKKQAEAIYSMIIALLLEMPNPYHLTATNRGVIERDFALSLKLTALLPPPTNYCNAMKEVSTLPLNAQVETKRSVEHDYPDEALHLQLLETLFNKARWMTPEIRLDNSYRAIALIPHGYARDQVLRSYVERTTFLDVEDVQCMASWTDNRKVHDDLLLKFCKITMAVYDESHFQTVENAIKIFYSKAKKDEARFVMATAALRSKFDDIAKKMVRKISNDFLDEQFIQQSVRFFSTVDMDEFVKKYPHASPLFWNITTQILDHHDSDSASKLKNLFSLKYKKEAIPLEIIANIRKNVSFKEISDQGLKIGPILNYIAFTFAKLGYAEQAAPLALQANCEYTSSIVMKYCVFKLLQQDKFKEARVLINQKGISPFPAYPLRAFIFENFHHYDFDLLWF